MTGPKKASTFNWLGHCASSQVDRACCYVELAVSSMVVMCLVGR